MRSSALLRSGIVFKRGWRPRFKWRREEVPLQRIGLTRARTLEFSTCSGMTMASASETGAAQRLSRRKSFSLILQSRGYRRLST